MPTNRRIQGTGEWIAGVLARQAGEAVDHLERERAIIDGFPARGESAGRGSSESSTTEAAFIQRAQIEEMLDEIRDAIHGISIAAGHLGKVSNKAIAFRMSNDPTKKVVCCRDNQHGREGAIVWGNPTCIKLPDKAGLCNACYFREWRWRREQAKPMPPRDIEPAAPADWEGNGRPFHAPHDLEPRR